ncbi:MAG: hypothetical protein V3S37_03340, partial [Dehalococcoidia bacterium]
TYIINLANLAGSTEQVRNIKDVLPQGGFTFCGPPTCDEAMYKVTDTPFDPETGDFTEIGSFIALNDPAATPSDGRWELFWYFITGESACALPSGCTGSGLPLSGAGGSTDTLVLRFQAVVTPTESGSYYNEVFTDVNCSAPQKLVNEPEAVTTTQDYCASYSWPTGGTLVPMYDVSSTADRSKGQGNVSVGFGATSLESWNVDDL